MSEKVVSIEIDGEELDLRPILERLETLEKRLSALESKTVAGKQPEVETK